MGTMFMSRYQKSCYLFVLFAYFSTPSLATDCSITKNTIPQLLELKNISFDENSALKDQYRALIKGTKSLSHVGNEAVEGLLANFDLMVKREVEHCEHSFVYYLGGGYPGLVVSAVKLFIRQHDQRSAREAFEQTLVGVEDKKHADRDNKIRSRLASVSTSLASLAPSESAVDIFLNARNVNVTKSALNSIIAEIMSSQDQSKVAKVQHLAEELQHELSRVIIQIFVSRDALSHLSYISKPYGFPVDVDVETILTALNDGPSGFANLVAGDDAIRRKMAGIYTVYGPRYGEPRYFDYLQARLFTSSSDYNDATKVKAVMYFLPSERPAAKKLIEGLRQIFSE